MLPRHWRGMVVGYIEERLFIFVLVSLLFITGIAGGAYSVNGLKETQKAELTQYLYMFFQSFKRGAPPAMDFSPAGKIIFSHFKTVFSLFLLGFSVIGTPVILFIVFTKGFILGFTVGFILKQLAGRGFLFAMSAVLPHHLLIIPTIIVAAVANIDFAGVLLKGRWGKKPAYPVSREFLRCLGINSAAFFLLFLAGLVEGVFSPFLIHWVAGLF